MRRSSMMAMATALTIMLAQCVALISPHNASSRDKWLRSISKGNIPQNDAWPPLTPSERAKFELKAQGWYEHALKTGPGGHLQWGQAMPQVIYADANMTVCR